MNSSSITPVVIVGAGPYGLSVAAHLRAANIDFRIFGRPMHRWRRQMPRGMFLKSEGFASNLSDPHARHTLAAFCGATGIAYDDVGRPVPLDVFTQYATAFQQALVPGVEEVMVDRIDRSGDAFELALADGERLEARAVVLATGLEHTEYVPPELATLPAALVSHVSAHHDLSRFKGTDVAVVGGGQSALETAALLAECGAAVKLLVRRPAIAWARPPSDSADSLYRRLRSPVSGLGSGLQLWAYCNVPHMFRYLPRPVRRDRFRTVLGPAGGWWLKERVVGKLPVLTDHVVVNAEARPNGARLHVATGDGRMTVIDSEHVIAATGYRFALERLAFLSPRLRAAVRTAGRLPRLSTNFESSVAGLYFTGLASGLSFGPVMRFMVGAGYTARRVSGHLAARASAHTPEQIGRLRAASQAR